MPRLFAPAIVTFAFLAACQGRGDVSREESSPKKQPASAQTQASTKKVTFDVEKMTCAACNHNVSTAAKGVDGVLDAKASNAKSKAWVTFDSTKTDEAAIAAAITRAGYPAKLTAGG